MQSLLHIAQCNNVVIVACSSLLKSTQIDYNGPQIVMALVGDSVTVKCSVGSATIDTRIQFYYNNTSYDHRRNNSQDIFVTSTFNLDDCSVHSTLTIQQFSEQFEGQYSCSATTARPTQTGENVTFSIKAQPLEAGNIVGDGHAWSLAILIAF